MLLQVEKKPKSSAPVHHLGYCILYLCFAEQYLLPHVRTGGHGWSKHQYPVRHLHFPANGFDAEQLCEPVNLQ